MPQLSETVFAPELDGGRWIQRGPVSLKSLRDKAVVLIDFWDYTCVNCIRTLPYMVAWSKRYKDSGLVVVGVHAPEFSFAREGSHVAEAAARFGLEYPIVLDNEYAIWRAYSNRCWPAKYLVDAKGRLLPFRRRSCIRARVCPHRWNRCATATIPARSAIASRRSCISVTRAVSSEISRPSFAIGRMTIAMPGRTLRA
jgi:thiol-disulfide isomerase/thioredoxin